MKLTKTTKIVTEDVEVLEGVYYYKDSNGSSYKTIIKHYEDDGIDYIHERVELFYNMTRITVSKDIVFESEEIPYIFASYITGIGGEKITEEEFNKQKQEVLNKLTE